MQSTPSRAVTYFPPIFVGSFASLAHYVIFLWSCVSTNHVCRFLTKVYFYPRFTHAVPRTVNDKDRNRYRIVIICSYFNGRVFLFPRCGRRVFYTKKNLKLQKKKNQTVTTLNVRSDMQTFYVHRIYGFIISLRNLHNIVLNVIHVLQFVIVCLFFKPTKPECRKPNPDFIQLLWLSTLLAPFHDVYTYSIDVYYTAPTSIRIYNRSGP